MNDTHIDPRYDPVLLAEARKVIEKRAAECERVVAHLRSAYADMQEWVEGLPNLHRVKVQTYAAIGHAEWHARFYRAVLANPDTAYFGNMVSTGKVSSG